MPERVGGLVSLSSGQTGRERGGKDPGCDDPHHGHWRACRLEELTSDGRPHLPTGHLSTRGTKMDVPESRIADIKGSYPYLGIPQAKGKA